MIFLGNGPPESLIFLGVYWCFRDGLIFHKKVIFAEKVKNHKNWNFRIFYDFYVKSAILRKMGSRAPGTPKSTKKSIGF